MDIKPINGNILVKIKRQNEVSGLILVHRQHEDKEPTVLAEVISIGDKGGGELNKGDTILMKGYSGRYAGETDDKCTRRAMFEEEAIAKIERKRKPLEVI